MINYDAAVILSGGGAYAAYELGIMRAVFSGESFVTGFQPLNPGIFTGTSAGAVNASIMASQPGTDILSTVDFLERAWLEEFTQIPRNCGNGVFRIRLDPVQYLSPACLFANPTRPFIDLAEDSFALARSFLSRGANFVFSTGSLQSRVLDLPDLSEFIASDAFPRSLRMVVDLEGIRNSERKMQIAATDWDTGEVKLFANQDLIGDLGYLSILASTAIPGIFPPVQIEGHTYVDGGLVMNTPLKPAIASGASVLHIIYMDPDVKNIPVMRLQNTLDVFNRILAINLAGRINSDIANAKRINDGLDVIRKLESGRADASSDDEIALIKVASQIKQRLDQGAPYRKLTIHRHHPKEDLGGGLGMLDFSRDSVYQLIQRGFRDGLRHNCLESECLLAEPIRPFF
jgi:NTE family protein